MSDTSPLTLERMRADVARMLHEDPQDIRDDDNLMDLGLDSMRIMKLASGWREAGANLDFADLAAEATLAHWWSIAARASGQAA
ncbi:phosphopantetheine-binding protein [Castellaniella sp. S9]|uniref:phosphopantetheine-binding protein n=1 Tax=Castellaniella sp. S9 TaxID=2993652 RepID=UPI0022B4F1E3|nr:phosphopantetheine-binding protein [Castellaniella sp. S9]